MNHPPPAEIDPLVRSTIAPLLRQCGARIRLELDLASDLPTVADPESFCHLLRGLVQEALSQMPDGGELTITGCQSESGWDLEIADSGPPAEERPRSRRIIAVSLGARLHWQNCPQGGCAVTVQFRPPMRRSKAA